VRKGVGGSIVNFSSQGWWTGGFGGSVGCSASKGGVVSTSRGLARSFAPDNVRVHVIAPGSVDTTMLQGGQNPLRDSGVGTPFISFTAQHFALTRVPSRTLIRSPGPFIECLRFIYYKNMIYV
jgi:NAD(P)-dependent dehydrogenase (short-subunit alcohol dehydrogenase family)